MQKNKYIYLYKTIYIFLYQINETVKDTHINTSTQPYIQYLQSYRDTYTYSNQLLHTGAHTYARKQMIPQFLQERETYI